MAYDYLSHFLPAMGILLLLFVAAMCVEVHREEQRRKDREACRRSVPARTALKYARPQAAPAQPKRRPGRPRRLPAPQTSKTAQTAKPAAPEAEPVQPVRGAGVLSAGGFKGNNVFAGQTVAFTGTLPGMTRREAIQAVQDNGGSAFETMPAGTTILVVGEKPGMNKLDQADRWGGQVRKITPELFKAMLTLPLTLSPDEFASVVDAQN